MKKLVISLLLLWSAGLHAANDFPPSFTAKYTLYAKGISVGEGTRTLTVQKDGTFLLESVGKTTGWVAWFKKIRIEERSKFTQQNGKIRPLEYTYYQTGKKTRYSHLSFHWYKNTATSTYKGETKEIKLEEGTLDRLLYQVVLMQELKQGKRQLEYKIANKGKISVYRPIMKNWERIETGIGELSTLKYERVSSNNERRTTLWCAPKLHYLPVQVEHVEKGEVFRLVLQSVDGLSPTYWE
ncbi:MAG TPA: DUF3108 domain-containing protein [Thioploca sp.]|nr:DUF3108 domain-containing protein [Thioploca sp.]